MGSADSLVQIRRYESSHASDTLRVFLEAITVLAAVDYTPEQISAWARPEKRDLDEWDRSMLARGSYVALVGGEVAGFSDVSVDGYVDMMFVSPRFARRGVARELLLFLEALAQRSSTRELFANVSITARPFFEALGFRVEAEQHPVVEGVALTNFRMIKELSDESWND